MASALRTCYVVDLRGVGGASMGVFVTPSEQVQGFDGRVSYTASTVQYLPEPVVFDDSTVLNGGL